MTESISRRYKVMIETTRDGFWVTDLKGNLLEANKAYADMSGYSVDELLNMHVTDLEALDDARKVKARIEYLIEHGQDRFESIHRHKDGCLFDVEVSINFISESKEFFAFFRDITERKKILRETESQLKRYQALMKNSLDGIHILDLRGNIIEINDAFCDMLGYTQNEACRLNIADWNSQYSGEELLTRLQSFVGKSARFETVHRRKDGTLIDVEISITGVEIEGQIYFFASSRDITKIKQADAISALLKFSLDRRQEALFIMDESGHFSYVNREACVSLGYDQSELMRMNVADIDPDRPAETWPEMWSYLKSQGAATFESRYKMKSGSIYYVQVSTSYFEFSGQPYILALARNITERIRTKNASLLQSEILSHVQEGVNVSRAEDETIVYTTPVLDRMFGYSEIELIGQKAGLLYAASTKPDWQISTGIKQVLNESKYWQGEINCIRKDGSTFWCWVKISCFNHHEFGNVWVSVHEDITLRKQIESDQEKARLLMHRDSLVREVHHRVKNNLQGITGILRLFAAKHPELAQPLNQAITQVQSIAVIHGLQGRSGLSIVRLCEMTSAIAAGIQALWNKPVIVDIPSNWPPRDVVESEAVPMALIINELLSNAVKHGDVGTDVTIRFGHETSRHSVIMSICNYGSIPDGFGLNKPDLFGIGLQLLVSLLPQRGIRLSWSQQGGKVITVLEVTSPIIALSELTG